MGHSFNRQRTCYFYVIQFTFAVKMKMENMNAFVTLRCCLCHNKDLHYWLISYIPVSRCGFTSSVQLLIFQRLGVKILPLPPMHKIYTVVSLWMTDTKRACVPCVFGQSRLYKNLIQNLKRVSGFESLAKPSGTPDSLALVCAHGQFLGRLHRQYPPLPPPPHSLTLSISL